MDQLENGVTIPYLQVNYQLIDDTKHFNRNEKWVFIVLMRHAFGGLAYPSQKTIAEKIGISDRLVRECLKGLQEKQFIINTGINQETQTVKWRVQIPEAIQIEWIEAELDRRKRKAEPNQIPQPPKDPEPKETIPYSDITEYLFAKTGKKFKSSGADTQKWIRARWNEGFRVDDFKKVIDNMTSKWLGDPEMDQYLRPKTLFGTKFEAYLNIKTKPNGPSFPNPPKRSRVGQIMTDDERAEMLREAGIQ